MSVKEAIPYLFFNGNAEDALELYAHALDAKVEGLMRYEQMPKGVGTCEPEDEKRVMHALVHIGRARLMVSDVTSDRAASSGGKVEILLEYDDAQEMARRFDALASSGTIKMGIHDAFWGAKFGALEDRFGIHWMFTCANDAS